MGSESGKHALCWNCEMRAILQQGDVRMDSEPKLSESFPNPSIVKVNHPSFTFWIPIQAARLRKMEQRDMSSK
jgi:hypothetical protein